jgi:hypothetical protein
MKYLVFLVVLLSPAVVCAQTASFAVPVQDTSGRAIANATVTYTCTDTVGGCFGFGPFIAISDTTGMAQFTGVNSGNYRVTLAGPGIVPRTYLQTVSSGTGSGMVYPPAGVPNSTGAAWGTSYSVTGGGTALLSALGNAATATALAANPTLCSTGQAPTGILASGNATGCASIGGSGSGIPYGIGGGTAQAQTVTTTPNITSLVSGTFVTWLPIAANTAAGPTLAAGTTAATVVTECGTVALRAGDLLPTVWALAQYDGTEWVLQDPVNGACEGGTPTTGGSANAQTLTLSPALPAYFSGLVLNVLAGFTNTGAMTLNAGPSAVSVTKCGTTALAAGDWTTTNAPVLIVVFDGTEFQLLNPQAFPCISSTQGNGAKVQLSTGTTTTNDCVKFDANGNTVDNGAACGGAATTNLLIPRNYHWFVTKTRAGNATEDTQGCGTPTETLTAGGGFSGAGTYDAYGNDWHTGNTGTTANTQDGFASCQGTKPIISSRQPSFSATVGLGAQTSISSYLIMASQNSVGQLSNANLGLSGTSALGFRFFAATDGTTWRCVLSDGTHTDQVIDSTIAVDTSNRQDFDVIVASGGATVSFYIQQVAVCGSPVTPTNAIPSTNWGLLFAWQNTTTTAESGFMTKLYAGNQ